MTLKEYCAQGHSSKLLDQWSDKNGDLTPAMVLTNSLAVVHWQCNCCGHTWRDTVKNRVGGTDCQVCKKPVKPEPRRQRNPRTDLTGLQFGRLTVVERQGIEKESLWLCRCDCGGEIVVAQSSLTGKKTTSCGCFREEVRKENFKNNIHFIDGTCIEKIAAKITPKNNTSGFRGVSQRPNGTFRVSITFKRKRYDLGTYKTKEEAIEARLAGEVMVDEFVEAYKNTLEQECFN
ncbi:zinc-ribbon domain-containing protein [Bengtsoniella intestinalis]|uniref:zinc-ribbon domain-containing protein n=1 Tax=Bengtsoniella intestinalis TaxID=3073143 RepID=UPI00391F785F